LQISKGKKGSDFLLETNLCGLKLRNPTVLASGILGTNAETLIRVAVEGGAGAVTMKSIGPTERLGHPNPTVIELEHGLLNAVGLPSPGYKSIGEEFAKLKKCPVPTIASVYGASVEEYAEVAAAVAAFKPAMIEANISCPNSKQHGQIFGVSTESASEVTRAVKKAAGSVPVMMKLTPQASNIAEIAKACEEAGADAICAINTVSGMAINIEARKPVLANKVGGYSSAAIKPIAVRCIFQIFEAVKIPILGLGGVTTGRDAVEMIQAGATAVGIGSGTYYRGIDVFKKVCAEMEEWMQANKVKSLKELVGVAHG
jgi:dihydroorotate dehydrogenase (NAD+) catalytic subunit